MNDLLIYSNRNFKALLLVQSSKFTRILGFILLFLMGSWGILLLFVPWQQTSIGSGRVLAYSPTERQQSIDAPVEGRLVKWFVHEGSVVKKGDPVVEITDNDPEILNRLQSEKHAVSSRLGAAQASTKIAKINLDRQSLLFKKGLSSRRAFEIATLEHAKYLTEEANSRTEMIRLQTRLARQTTQSVSAPRDGVILRRIAGESSVLVKSGDSLAVLVPDTNSRAVELLVDGNDISLIKEGQDVMLQFEGWPAVQFTGWPSIAVGTFPGKISIVDAADSGNGKFRILVSPAFPDGAVGAGGWPSSLYLRQGVRVQGWVLLGQVKLGYELWRRFNGFPPLRSSVGIEIDKQKKSKK